MIVLEDAGGLFFCPRHRVATLTPEWSTRQRVVLADGRMAFTTGQPPLVNRAHVTPQGSALRDPAGFLYALHQAQDVPVPPHDPLLWVELTSQGAVCHSDDGAVPAPDDSYLQHPGLVQVRHDLWLNRARLGRIRKGSGFWDILFDDGTLALKVYRNREQEVAEALGLDNLSRLALPSGLMREQMRDYPFELELAPAELLQEFFLQPRPLIANLIFQALRYRQLGVERENGLDHRGFWYDPIYATIGRAGFLQDTPDRGMDSPLYLLYTEMLQQLVGSDRLFTFSQLGFEDPNEGQLGSQHADTLLLVEKQSLQHYAEALTAEFGLSWIVTRGAPKLVDSEFFARRLLTLGRPIQLVAYVDFDPQGYALARAFAEQLRRFGVPVHEQIHFLVRCECFTAEELELYAMPCPMSSTALATQAREWVEESGGVHGQALGVHANHLQPVARVRAELARILGLS